jgi:hypothetical protein
MVQNLTTTATRCLICHRPVVPHTLTCDPDCAQAWRIFAHFRAHEGAQPPPGPISLALARLARGEPALVR